MLMVTSVVGVVTVIRESNAFGTISLYPVPAVTELNINFSSDIESATRINVFDVAGRTIMSRLVNVTAGENNITLDVNELPVGVYMITIDNGDAVQTEKFLKN